MSDLPMMGLAALLACKAALNQRVVAVLLGKLAATRLQDEMRRVAVVPVQGPAGPVSSFMGIPIYVAHWLPVGDIRLVLALEHEMSAPGTPQPWPGG